MTDSKQTSTVKKSFSLNQLGISPEALYIVKALQRKGFTTYLVGGCVRDLLLDKHPKDFDIATNALPKDVRKLISNAFIIGKRFQLVLVKRGDDQYEVSTFRRDPKPDEINAEDRAFGDNIFGTPQEDARRRDFTINALFYDPVEHELIDYADGLRDLESGVVRMIGDPNVRLNEDPIRIMRGIRLAHMIRFSLDSDLRTAIEKHAVNLATTALPRRREEILKYLRLENPALPFLTSLDLGALQHISPSIAEALRNTSRSGILLNYLFSFHDKKLETPSELFAGFMMAYFLTEHQGEFPDQVRTNDILESERYVRLMRDELGMFKHEQTNVAKALHLMTLFRKKSDFQNRGERRRAALIANEAFPLALKLAEREHWLSASDLHFWQTEYGKMAESGRLPSGQFSGGPGGGRRRPKRRRKNQSGGGRADGPSSSSSKTDKTPSDAE